MPTEAALMNSSAAMKAASPSNTAQMSQESVGGVLNYSSAVVGGGGGGGNNSLSSSGRTAHIGPNGSRGRVGGNVSSQVPPPQQQQQQQQAASNAQQQQQLSQQQQQQQLTHHGHHHHHHHGKGPPVDAHGWSRGGIQFASPREVYTRSLHRICLKFTTSEDEDEGKPEPATAYWTLYGKATTIGNGGPGSPQPDDICRRMDDSMSGPNAGLLARITDHDGEAAALHSTRAGLTCAWHVRGERGDAAVRVGKARVSSSSNETAVLSLDADRWVLCKGASFAAGNSIFAVEEFSESKRSLTIHCTRGPMRGRLIDVSANRCPFVFGRAHEADLCIMDRELSRRHGAILYFPHSNNTNHSNNSNSNTNNNNSNNNSHSNNNNHTSNNHHSKGGSFILVDLESTNGSYMRLVGPYSHRGQGALSLCDEFIVGRTGFSVNRFDFGISEAIGARPTMEDRTVVIQSLMFSPPFSKKYINRAESKDSILELAMTSFCAVFDGHGGDECSNYLVESLPRQVRSHMLMERENLAKAIEASRRNGVHSEQGEDAASELMRRILKASFLRADKEFITPKTAPQSGSTAATVILMGRRLFAANVGDSRVVLCRGGGQCVELTSDHKPSRPDEAARVRAAGGFILHKRVMGELAITRAFGDKSFKMGIKAMLEEESEVSNGSRASETEIAKDLTAPLVSAEPEIASMVLSHNDEFLLLACDGLFDVFRSQDAVALARQELIAHRGEPAEVARILSDQAIRVRRSRDNVSILIVVLRPFWESQGNGRELQR